MRADAETKYFRDQATANHDLHEKPIVASTGLVNGAIGAGTTRSKSEVGDQ